MEKLHFWLKIEEHNKSVLLSSDEFELKFPELSRAELGRLRAELSLGISIFELKPN